MKKLHISQLLMTAGGLWAALGTFALASPLNAFIIIVRYSGAILLLNGLLLVAASYTRTSTTRERKWIRAEGILDLLFSFILLLDPVLSVFAFPYMVGPWLAAKGLLKMIASLSLAKNIPGWSGDFAAGGLLILFVLLIPHDPMETPSGVPLLVGVIGWTMGLLYLYDSLRFRKKEHHMLADANHTLI